LRPTGYLPLPKLSTRLAVLYMPSLGLLTSFGTWCHCGVWELQEAGRAVVGLSPLLHVVEAFLEAAPSSVIIWTALYQVGGCWGEATGHTCTGLSLAPVLSCCCVQCSVQLAVYAGAGAMPMSFCSFAV
jgi:hypothetical protein